MRAQSLGVVLGTAAVTMTFTVLLLMPGGVQAVNVAEKIKPVIYPPRLTSHNAVFVLTTDKPEYQADERPGITVTATNPTDKPVDATVWISISASAPTSIMARMLPVPEVLWSHPWCVSLQPGEVKKLSVSSEAKLPAKKSISITLTDRQMTVLARKLSVPDKKVADKKASDKKAAPAAPAAGAKS